MLHKDLLELKATLAVFFMQLLKRFKPQAIEPMAEHQYFKWCHFRYVGQYVVGKPEHIKLWAIGTRELEVHYLGEVYHGRLIKKSWDELHNLDWSIQKGTARLYKQLDVGTSNY